MADMKDKKEETIHQEEEAVKAEDVTETAETAESAESTETSEAEQAQESAGEKKSFFDKKKDKRQQPWKKNWQILKTKEFANWQSLKTSASVPRKKSLRCLKWEQRML